MLCSRSPHGERGLKLSTKGAFYIMENVALLTESVDWNGSTTIQPNRHLNVALLTESVDWNILAQISPLFCSVALLTESVDWNIRILIVVNYMLLSLSSRRAWIEISFILWYRNLIYSRSPHGERGLKSIPLAMAINKYTVALLTESVDWNMTTKILLSGW